MGAMVLNDEYDPERHLWKPGRRTFLFMFGAAAVGTLAPSPPPYLLANPNPELTAIKTALRHGLVTMRECFVFGGKTLVIDDGSGIDPGGLLSRPVPGGLVIGGLNHPDTTYPLEGAVPPDLRRKLT